MNNSISYIPFGNLAFAFIPTLAVVVILKAWAHDYRKSLYAIARMLVQLLLIGYFLSYVFGTDSAGLVVAVIAVMLFSASLISMRSVGPLLRKWYPKALGSIALGGGLTLIVITQAVLRLNPWYLTSFMIPLAGMIFSNAMNSVSIAAERLNAELSQGSRYQQARNAAFRAALIPITNSLLAVGLVALPGMMTGQILSGVSPLLAVRYQIMVMCMVYGSAGISAACFLTLAKTETIPAFADA